MTRLSHISNYQTGGSCDELLEAESLQELAAQVRGLHQKGKDFYILGAGSNSLLSDTHWPGAVISLRQMRRIAVENDQRLVCSAGLSNSEVAQIALEHEFAGAAWMHRLPGQLGGTVRMNARCFGGEISQIVEKIVVVDSTGQIQELTAQGIFRGYKDTALMDKALIVAEVTLALTPGKADELVSRMQACERDRIRAGHFRYPSCGCVFKNDYQVGVSSGLLLDLAGCKSIVQGGASVNPDHANFVYNRSGASSRDILEITLRMREAVWREFGVWLAYEMEILGALPADLKKEVHTQRKAEINVERLAEAKKLFLEKINGRLC